MDKIDAYDTVLQKSDYHNSQKVFLTSSYNKTVGVDVNL